MIPFIAREMIDYDYESNKPARGENGGTCNRIACQRSNAIYFNKVTHKYYCRSCAKKIHQHNVELDLFSFEKDKL